MKIEITSRKEIEQRAKSPFPKNTAIISITDFEREFAELQNTPGFILRLKFDDVNDDIFNELLKRKPTESEMAVLSENFHEITDSDAEKIAAFYNDIKDKADILICQCEYGESRSAACAAAILEYSKGRGKDIFSDERYYPNKLVFKKVLEALNRPK